MHAHHALCRRFAGAATSITARSRRRYHLVRDQSAQCKGIRHESENDVGLAFIDAKANAYLSITARAEVRRDHAKAAEIWKPTDNMWWKGPDDPNACLLRVTPLTAELWDGPASKAVGAFEFVRAQLTGGEPNLGEHRKITVDLR